MRNMQQLGIEVTNFLVIGLQLYEECSLAHRCNTKFVNPFFIPPHVIYRTLFFLNFGVVWKCFVELRPIMEMCRNFPKIEEKLEYFSHQNCDMKQFHTEDPQILRT
jgi:hypothetical protein